MNYHNNLNCSWIIEVANADIISIHFTEFRTEPYWDYVLVFDGISLDSPHLTYTGYPLPLNIVSSGNKVMVVFTTDGSGTTTGLSFTYEGVENNTVEGNMIFSHTSFIIHTL